MELKELYEKYWPFYTKEYMERRRQDYTCRAFELELAATNSFIHGLVLDVGCGPGDYLAWLNAREVIGLDPIIYAVLTAKNFAPVVMADAHFLPFRDEVLDCISMIHVIEHVEPHRVLREAKRVLKPEGRIVIITPDGDLCPSLGDPTHITLYTKEELGDIVEEYFRIEVLTNIRDTTSIFLVGVKDGIR